MTELQRAMAGRIAEAGGVAAAARLMGVGERHARQIARGERGVSRLLCHRLGWPAEWAVGSSSCREAAAALRLDAAHREPAPAEVRAEAERIAASRMPAEEERLSTEELECKVWRKMIDQAKDRECRRAQWARELMNAVTLSGG